MQTGFLLEGDPGSMRTVTKWVEGTPESSILTGLKIGDRAVLPVTTYRCAQCGRLESFALSEAPA
jgi:hypothetical protein